MIDQEDIANNLIYMAAQLYLQSGMEKSFISDCDWELKKALARFPFTKTEEDED